MAEGTMVIRTTFPFKFGHSSLGEDAIEKNNAKPHRSVCGHGGWLRSWCRHGDAPIQRVKADDLFALSPDFWSFHAAPPFSSKLEKENDEL
ncbi:MAG TPA: hypothetical protein VKZ53_15610 [Candidatus Angelobacter sp.]|nr:hypothetical protein [Candidatus Angelobacter sp.]